MYEFRLYVVDETPGSKKAITSLESLLEDEFKGLYSLEIVDILSGFLIAFSTGAFLYLAASELIPELQEEKDFSRSLIQFAVFILGLIVIWYLGIIFHE